MRSKRLRDNWDIYAVIVDPTRRSILDLLMKKGPIRTTGVAEHFPEISRPAISKHLRILRDHELVKEERVGRERFQVLTPKPLHEVNKWTAKYEIFWQENLQKLKRMAEQV